jgi:photosystem II stability/assembly factor-like uncharacterized protein
MRLIQFQFLLWASLACMGSAMAQGSKRNPAPATSTASTALVDYNAYFSALKWRSIGPFRGGRSVCATGVVGDPTTYYMGTTGGGVWKTDDMGLTWRNISDGYMKTGSVGAIAVAETNPNIVYVGMGEHAPRGVMTHHGDGMYKSTDAGKTWKKIGLDSSQHIARVVIHPQNPEVVYVAAQGPLYGPGTQRGIFRSTNGGATWERVLFVNENTGCSELSMDMNNPTVLYAAMWEHGRRPWQVISGGEGSGLYKSTDGGTTWNKIHNGLPKEMGKMAIAVSRSNSEKLYALIESDSEKELGGLFMSSNAGGSWTRVSDDQRLEQRAWYYIELFIDPKNEHTVYVLSAPALRTEDAGKTWENLSGTHGDYHDLWINPHNPKNMVIANDGGAAISVNYGETWSTQSNMPTAQFYRINTDNQFPYRIYGGQQDNTSVAISSRELGNYGITESAWQRSAGGESAFLAFDPDNPRYVLGGSYQGTIEVMDMKSGASVNIMPAPIQYLGMDAKDMRYRYNWNAPIIWSKHEPNVFYHGAQVLLKTTDTGRTWKEVSPDLTRNLKEKQGKGGVPYTNEAVGAENYGTLAYVMESPHEKGVIYTGSDDGYVFVTRDGGATWQNITPPGLAECLVNAIEVSPHDKATVYIATTRYKFNDHRPGLYKSTDYGKTWTAINTGIAANAFTRVVREDDVRKDLLYAGTELGVFLSWDGGKNWSSFQRNLPVTPITDLKVHKGNLIAATSGRSFWILDDLSLIRQYKDVSEQVMLYQPDDVMLMTGGSSMNGNGNGTNPTMGVNPATGLVLYYYLPEMKEDEHITLEIKDAAGKTVRTLTSKRDATHVSYPGGPGAEPVLPKSKGLNRFVWDLRYPNLPGAPTAYIEGSFRGHRAITGKYSANLQAAGKTESKPFSIVSNPLYPQKPADEKIYHETLTRMEAAFSDMHHMTNSMQRRREQLDALLAKLPKEAKYEALRKEAKELSDRMKAWDEEMIQRKSKAYDDVENFPNKFSADYLFMMNQTENDVHLITQPTLDLEKELNAKWAKLKQSATKMLETDIPALNKKLYEAGIGALWMH